MMLGRIDEVDGHYIATKFFVVVPLRSMYVGDKRGQKSGPIAIKPNWKSAGLGFARVWLPVIGVVWPVIVGWGPNGSIPIWGWLISVVLLAISGYAHRLGRLPEDEKARLRLLGTVTGMRIDPAKLLPSTRRSKREALEDLMTKGGIPTAPADIIAVLDDIPIPALALVYGFARYSGDDAVWTETAEHIYERHERGEL
jgi:hypothetical protein